MHTDTHHLEEARAAERLRQIASTERLRRKCAELRDMHLRLAGVRS